MINILEQDVPTTASVGSFGGAESSNTRTDNPYFEKKFWFSTPFTWQRVLDYLNNNEFLQTTSVNAPSRLFLLERYMFGWSLLFNDLDSKDSLSQLIASIRGSLAEEIPVRKTAFTHEVALALYERALEILNLRDVSKSRGLTQTTALRKLDELKNLPEDWDSYGADPISPNAIAKAKSIIISAMLAFGRIIDNVVQLTDVIPIADGGVQLEWVGPHAELEIEISPNGNVGLLYISVSEDRREYQESKDNSLQDVYTSIARLIHSQYSN